MAANMGLPPGPLAAYLGVRNANQDAGLNTIRQATGIQGLLAKLNEQKQLEMARGVMSGNLPQDQKMQNLMNINPALATKYATDMKSLEEYQQGQKFKTRMTALGPNPSQDSLAQLAAQFASPKDILTSQTSSMDRKAALEQARILREQSRVPMGYTQNPDGTLRPISGGPADAKIQGKLNEDTARLDSLTSNMDRLGLEANTLLKHPGLEKSTDLMSWMPLYGGLATVPGTDAANFKAGLNTLLSQAGFSVLQSMRDASKTGGALGQVSDFENKLLQSNLAALERSQSSEQFKTNLNKIIKYTEESKNRLRNAYNLKYRSGDAGQTDGAATTQPPAGRNSVLDAADAILKGK